MPKKPVKRKVVKEKPSRPSKVTPVSDSPRKSVNITKASNGYVVSSYDNEGEKTMIAKTKAEAKAQATKLLGI